MVPIRRDVSKRSTLTSALMYSPVAASVEWRVPLSYMRMTASGSPRWLRLRRCEACHRKHRSAVEAVLLKHLLLVA